MLDYIPKRACSAAPIAVATNAVAAVVDYQLAMHKYRAIVVVVFDWPIELMVLQLEQSSIVFVLVCAPELVVVAVAAAVVE